MTLKLPIGISDFRHIQEEGFYYVDKTHLIQELIDLSAETVLLPRPRRFGKTTNLSMLRYFFEKTDEDLTSLFKNLYILSAEAGPACRAHFQRYPVIYLTFKDVKRRSFEECLARITLQIQHEFRRHSAALLASGVLADWAQAELKALCNGSASTLSFQASLQTLTKLLHQVYKQRVVLLIDEYDVPIQAGFQYDYYDEVTAFFRNFLSAGLKDNASLHKGVLTGVLRIARESIFSGLNNITVYSLLETRFATAFGFTEAEVLQVLTDLGRPELMEEVREWYNGYRFGGHIIYNPWSLLHYAMEPEQGPRPYWVHTSSDDVLRELVLERGYAVLEEFQRLLEGQMVTTAVNEHLSLRDLMKSPSAIWSLLLFSGYLTAERTWREEGEQFAELRIPNREVRFVFRQSVLSWIAGGPEGADRLDRLLAAMLRGDTRRFAGLLGELALRVLSSHDTAGQQPERVYHGFVLGMLVRLLPRYEISSNRESGHGRYDVALLPRRAGDPGVVLEFKVARSGTEEAMRRALVAAAAQIEQRRYDQALRERGAQPIYGYAVACHGKRVFVQRTGDARRYGLEDDEEEEG